MTQAARFVLQDCREAAAQLVDGLQGNEWRRQWILVLVLLRAVGHVLDKIDCERSPEYRRSVCDWWSALKRTKPDPAIFWQFIDEERNSLIKQYQTSAVQKTRIEIPLAFFTENAAEQSNYPPIFSYTMQSGPFAGRDQSEVVADAIRWWESALDAIDEATKATLTPARASKEP